MTVRVRIPGIWRGLTEGEAGPLLTGGTVGEVLWHLAERYPAMRDRLFDSQGALKRHLHIFLNQVDIRGMEGLATSVRDGDEILLLLALAGG